MSEPCEPLGKIKIKNVEYEIEIEDNDTQGCLRNKIRIAKLEERIKAIEKTLGIKE